MEFTRYLYNVDEVILTFLEKLLKQENLNECYFWIYEYYKSGYVSETWNILYKIYYDFYALQNPKLEKKMNEYYDNYQKTKNIKFILSVVKNLFRFKKDYEIFMMRVYYNKRKLDKLNMQDIELDNYNIKKKEEILLVHSIKEKKNQLIAYYLQKLVSSDLNRLLELLKLVFKKDIVLNKNYKNNYHQLLVFILNSINVNKVKRVCYKIVNIKEVKNVLKSDEEYYNKGKHQDVSYAHETLSKHRLYSISENIGCFKLKRKKIDLNHLFWYKWEYCAYKSPIWKNRFSRYKIKVNHEKKLIDFDDDDELEEFYFRYGYEPDEQSKEIQDKSIKEIKNNYIHNWINEIFDNKMQNKIRIKFNY